MDRHFKVTGIKLKRLFAEYKANYAEYNKQLLAFLEKYGADSFFQDPWGGVNGISYRKPLPKGWTANRKKTGMFPNDRSILPQLPSDKAIADVLQLPDRIAYTCTMKKPPVNEGSSGFTANSLSFNSFLSFQPLWVGDSFYVVLADPTDKIEKLREVYKGKVKLEPDSWKPPTGLKEILKEEYDLKVAKFNKKKAGAA